MVRDARRDLEYFSHRDERANIQRSQRRGIRGRALQQRDLVIPFRMAPFKSLPNFCEIRGAGGDNDRLFLAGDVADQGSVRNLVGSDLVDRHIRLEDVCNYSSNGAEKNIRSLALQ